jgi:hypothetical protein
MGLAQAVEAVRGSDSEISLHTGRFWRVAALRDWPLSANSCLSEPAEIAPERSSPRSSIIMLIFGLFIGRLIHGQKR